MGRLLVVTDAHRSVVTPAGSPTRLEAILISSHHPVLPHVGVAIRLRRGVVEPNPAAAAAGPGGAAPLAQTLMDAMLDLAFAPGYTATIIKKKSWPTRLSELYVTEELVCVIN